MFFNSRLKRLKTEGRSQLYLDNMVVIFFSNILDTMKEYTKCFSTKTSSVSGMYIRFKTNLKSVVVHEIISCRTCCMDKL